MKKLPPTTDRFRFLTEKSIKRDKIELTRFQSAQLRAKLPKGIYYIQCDNGQKTMMIKL